MFGNSSTYFQELLLEGLIDHQALPTALECLNQTCGSETAQLIVLSSTNRILESAIVGTVDQELFQKEEEYLPINPRVKMLSAMETAHVVQDHDYVDDDLISSNAAYQELLIPAQVGRFAGAVLSRGADDRTVLAIAQPWEMGPLDQDAGQRFSDLVRQAIPVVHLSQQLATTRAASLLDMLGPDACAAIVGQTGTLMDCTEAFEQLLSTGIIGSNRFGQINLKSERANKAFATSLKAEATGIGDRFLLNSPPFGDAFVCTIAPVPPTGIFGGRFGHAILFLDRASSPRRLDRHGVMEAYSLTEEEYQICERLVTGERPGEIAERTGLSEIEIDSALWKIKMKTSSRRKTELVRKLLQHPMDLHDWRPFGTPAQL